MIHRPLRPILALLLALLTCSCGTSRAWFRPAERALTESVGGFIAAQYELQDAGKRWGEVRVWSTGAAREDDRERDAPTGMAIAFEIENTSDEELELVTAEIRLKEIETRRRRIDAMTPAETGPSTRIGPNAVVGARFRFTFPDDIDPDDIDSFRVRWVLTSPEGKRFTQFTTFVRSYYRGHRRHRGYSYWYPTFVFGLWGFHSGHHWRWR